MMTLTEDKDVIFITYSAYEKKLIINLVTASVWSEKQCFSRVYWKSVLTDEGRYGVVLRVTQAKMTVT